MFLRIEASDDMKGAAAHTKLCDSATDTLKRVSARFDVDEASYNFVCACGACVGQGEISPLLQKIKVGIFRLEVVRSCAIMSACLREHNF